MKLFLLALLFASTAFAADQQDTSRPELIQSQEASSAQENRSYFTLLSGAALSTSSGGGNAFTYGGHVGTGLFDAPHSIFSLGVYVGTASDRAQVESASVNGRYTIIAGELLTRRIFGTGLYVGGRFGLGIVSISYSNPSNGSYGGNGDSFVASPVLGYELSLARHFDISMEAAWVVLSSSYIMVPNIGAVFYNAISAVTLQGGLTYHW
jgi:hypothetical protein